MLDKNIALLAAGLYFILADKLKRPTISTAKAMLNVGKENKKAAKTVEAWLMSGAAKLSKYIRINVLDNRVLMRYDAAQKHT